MNDPEVESVTAAAYTVPTDAPEADGTLAWDSVTLVLAQVRVGGEQGIGWTYGSPALRCGSEHCHEGAAPPGRPG